MLGTLRLECFTCELEFWVSAELLERAWRKRIAEVGRNRLYGTFQTHVHRTAMRAARGKGGAAAMLSGQVPLGLAAKGSHAERVPEKRRPAVSEEDGLVWRLQR